MKRFHLILCSGVVIVLVLAGCQTAEEREANDLRAALTEVLDESEEKMQEHVALLEALWEIELEYGNPEGEGFLASYRFYPSTNPTMKLDLIRGRYESEITAGRNLLREYTDAELPPIASAFRATLAQLDAVIPTHQEQLDNARAAIAAEPEGGANQ